jgi:hypothetical protein
MKPDRKWRKRKETLPPSKIDDLVEVPLQEQIDTVCKEVPIGDWFVMVGNELVSHGPDFDQVVAEARKKYPEQELFIDRLPRPGPMVLRT